jgi:hypothetical protein
MGKNAYFDLDSMINYAVSKHEVDYVDSNEGGKDSDNCGTELLAYMAGQKSSSGDIWQVLASKQEPNKNKKRQVNEGTSAPSTATINGTTYYYTKGKPSISNDISILPT